MRDAAGRLRQSTSSPTSPPNQSEPESRCSQSSSSESPRGDGLRGVPGGAGHDQDRRGGERGAAGREQLGDRALRPLGPVDPERDRRCGDEQREAELEVEVAAAERRDVQQRHERAEVRHRAQREVGGREQRVERDRDEPDDCRDEERDRERAQARARRRAGRPAARSRAAARAARSRPSPTRNDDPARGHEPRRRGRLRGRRDRELRRRPGVRPDRERERAAHRVAVDRDRAPVDEVPALGELLERDEQRVGVRRRAARRARSSPAARPRR